jgi:hypothetical protein
MVLSHRTQDWTNLTEAILCFVYTRRNQKEEEEMAQRGEVVTDGIEYPTAPSEEQTTARAA